MQQGKEKSRASADGLPHKQADLTADSLRRERRDPPLVSIVIPCFNESAGLDALVAALDAVAAQVNQVDIEYVFINDGSGDDTLRRLLQLASGRGHVQVVDLSRNFGKEAALSAGLLIARGDAVIPMDADLQDPPELIVDMIEQWLEGAEVVLAQRVDRSEDSFPKRVSARAFYRMANWLSDVPIPQDVGDFRLIDRVVVDTLNSLPENRRFMKGLFAWAGFRTKVLTYRREARHAGQSSFNGWRLWNLALEGITSFSIAPLRVWTYVGLAVAVPAFTWGLWIVFRTLFFGVDVPGYASIFVAVLFFGGLQLVGIGMIGEYLGRTYLESKRRPAFIIRKVYHDEVD